MRREIRPEDLPTGKLVHFREVEIGDAEFLLDLRTNPKKSQFLNPTVNDLQRQKLYIESYKARQEDWYFVLEDKSGIAIGCIRIYNIEGNQFTIGSWIMTETAPELAGLEATILTYQFAFEYLGLETCLFDVRKENRKVLRFHKLYGARVISETELDFIFCFDRPDFGKMKERFSSFV